MDGPARTSVDHLSRALHAGSTDGWNGSSMVAAILSPHLDDAVLSCWHLLAQRDALVVINVFTGVPASVGAAAWWDRLTGATDSRQRVRERVDEDRRALALAGRTPANLGFLDEQYRERDQSLAPLTARVEGLLAPGAHIYAPAALGGHADHTLVRAAALELLKAGFAVSLYADLPHATLHGWPAWVTGRGDTPSQDLAAALWERSLAETGVSPESMVPMVHELDAVAHARKLAAIRAYRTQLHGLAELAGRPLTDRETLGFEVMWKLPDSATAWPGRAHDRAAPRP
jgi:GlcNAc-PI de-N-acetylase